MSQITRVAAAALAFKLTKLGKQIAEAVSTYTKDATGLFDNDLTDGQKAQSAASIGLSVEKLDAAAVKLAWVTAEVLRIKAQLEGKARVAVR